MTHDPLCPMPTSRFMAAACQCHLIRPARADERERAAERVAALLTEWNWNPRWIAKTVAAARGGDA